MQLLDIWWVCLLTRNCQTVLQIDYYFAFLPAMKEISQCFISLPTFSVVRILDICHSNRCVMVPHCCFNLQLPNDIWYGESSQAVCLLWLGGVSSDLLHTFKWIILFCHYWVLRVLRIFWITLLYQIFFLPCWGWNSGLCIC